MIASRPFSNATKLLRTAQMGPTRQRLALVRLLFEQGHRHVTAEQLHGEVVEAAVPVSLATVYNTLHQFVEAGLLREVVVNSGRSCFDSNVSDHHHFLFEDTGRLLDIPGELVAVSGPEPPAGAAIRPYRRAHPRRAGPRCGRPQAPGTRLRPRLEVFK